MSEHIQAVIIGAGGYVGGELIRLIASHPEFQLAAAVSDSRNGQKISDTFAHLSLLVGEKRFTSTGDYQNTLHEGANVALFSAAPHGASASIIATALEAASNNNQTLHIVDASADFRFSEQSQWEAVYGSEHGAPALLSSFSCAVPEHADTVSTAHIGHPGCFATAMLLAAVPLISANVSEAEIFVSGVTGSTGSGRSPQAGTHHPERNSNLYAYKPLNHRHAPEVAALTQAASGRSTKVHFVPHSGPFARGIHITLHAKATQKTSDAELHEIFQQFYANSPFVEVKAETPRVKNVVASNCCHLHATTDGDAIVVMSVIDNLVKGAAGGAVQWMNRLWELPETTGLLSASPGWT